MSRTIAHESNRCTLWARCSGVSWKRPFTFSLRRCKTWLDKGTLIMSQGVFGFLSASYIWWTKGDTIVQEEPLCICSMDTTVHDTELLTFWTSNFSVRNTLFTVRNAWICSHFDHSIPSWFQVQCTQPEITPKPCFWRVFCFPDVNSYGSRVLHDLD